MKGIILAAGRGSRMGDVTASQPKCLTVLGQHTLLDWQLTALRKANIDDIAIVSGYRGEMLKQPNITAFENPHWARTNMVSSLVAAESWLETETCIISYSDIAYRSDIVTALKAADGDIAITYDLDWLNLWSLRFDDPLSDAETFSVDDDGILVEIGNKTSLLTEIQGQYMGLLKITPIGWNLIKCVLEMLEKNATSSLDMTSLLQALIESGQPIHTSPIRGGWVEVDSECDLELYDEAFLQKQRLDLW